MHLSRLSREMVSSGGCRGSLLNCVFPLSYSIETKSFLVCTHKLCCASPTWDDGKGGILCCRAEKSNRVWEEAEGSEITLLRE